MKQHMENEITPERLGLVEEIAGHGIQAQIDGRTVYAGNAKLMELKQISFEPVHAVGTIVYVAVEYQYADYLLITDEVKEDAKEAIAKLKQLGIKKTVMLTGDRKSVAEQVANELGIDEVHSDLLPADKVEQMEAFICREIQEGQAGVCGGTALTMPLFLQELILVLQWVHLVPMLQLKLQIL